jgi:hypothetical protein
MWRKWIEVAVDAFRFYAGPIALLCPSSEEDSWMASLLKSFYAPLLPPRELVDLLDQPIMKSLAELVKKTVDLLPRPSENYLVCRLPCVLTETSHGTLKATSKRTRCCFRPHYKQDQVPFKLPSMLIISRGHRPERRCLDPDLVTKIDQLFTSKCTAIQSVTVAILTHELTFKTHTLDSTIVYLHNNYNSKNAQSVMNSLLTEEEDLLNPYEATLANSLVWIKKKGSQQHPAIHFEDEREKADYLDWVQTRHKCILKNKSMFAKVEGVFIV